MVEQKISVSMFGKGNKDEKYTPEYAIKPIIKYIPKDYVIWCPFDTKESNFVKLLSKTHKVIYSHIDNAQDFFNYTPKEHFDIIVSNPPFTRKRQIFEKALSFNKPIALLMTNAWLNDKYSKWVFYESGRNMELLMFDKRVHFINPDGSIEKKTTFSSSYYCSDLLPRDIVLEELTINE